MGLRIGGMTYRQIADQSRRIAGCGFEALAWDVLAACRTWDGRAGTRQPAAVTPSTGCNKAVFTAFERTSGPPATFSHLPEEPQTTGRLVDAVLRREHGHMIPVRYASGETSIKDFPDQIVLGHAFYREATAESVSLRRVALRQISDNSWAIDLYIWLAHQLPKLCHPVLTDWKMLSSHFDMGYRHPRQMKAAFIQALQLVLAIYPEAHVEICESGFRLYPARPPVLS
jgi:hypothetical protein